MLLVLDVGNSNTVLGLYGASSASNNAGARYDQLIAHWRVTTLKTQTVDEYGVLFRNLFAADAIEVNSVKHIIISSVVPPVDSILREVCKRYFGVTPLFVEPGVKTGMPVQYDNPAEVGADRIDRKSTRLNSSHLGISYAVFCLKKKIKNNIHTEY